MELKIIEANNQKIAEIVSDDIVINDTQGALDLMAEAGYYQAKCIILSEFNLKPDFFELRTGMAGEILQKFSQYSVKLAIIGEFEKYKSKSLKAFIVESNRGNQIFFVPDRDTAIARLSG
jgi:hypothetical protein